MQFIFYQKPKILVKFWVFSLHAKFGLWSGCDKQNRHFLRVSDKKDSMLYLIYSKDFEI